MRIFKSAIIGCGAIFPMHAASLMTMGNVALAAVCDIDIELAKQRAKECSKNSNSCNYYTDYKKMIDTEKPDVVHICLPHYLHAPVSAYALEHGCHVLTEKPMAISIPAAQKMLNVAKASNKTLGVIFQNRYNPGSLLIKNTIESGKLGEILGGRASVWWHRSDEYYADSPWRGTIKHSGGGVVVNQAIHTLDLALWFFGHKPYSVAADIDNVEHPRIEVEDEAQGVIRFQNGAVCNFTFLTYYSYDAPIEIEVHCENGIAKLVGDVATITFNDGRVLTAQNDTTKQIEYGNMKNYWGMSHVYQITDFYRSIEHNKPLFVDLESVLITTKVMSMILKSGKKR